MSELNEVNSSVLFGLKYCAIIDIRRSIEGDQWFGWRAMISNARNVEEKHGKIEEEECSVVAAVSRNGTTDVGA
ncbi:unnamed protein product [Soboliphyme baturini]|uniref:Rhodanese domain-containing protein n=1 Tax=Soboliphyme baturini TaxID=241478 RepID=A0A183IKI7_9BILA|nr:unnamed protein product [Soboliphyme baturini]